jgi:hypothetical protein
LSHIMPIAHVTMISFSAFQLNRVSQHGRFLMTAYSSSSPGCLYTVVVSGLTW